MPDITIDNRKVSVSDGVAQRVRNVLDGQSISKYLDSFWTDKKLGKHKDMKRKHGEIILRNLKGDVVDLFDRIGKLSFDVKDGKTYLFKDLLTKTGLDEFLSLDYIKDCMSVTTTRPAIGRGEFLLVSIFPDIGFASGAGDLVSLESGTSIEVKGPRSVLGNGQNSKFKAMSDSLLYSTLQQAGIRDMASTSDFDAEFVQLLKKRLGSDEGALANAFASLQNLRQEYVPLGSVAVDLYKEKKQFLRTVAAEHLFAYMNIQDIDRILFHDGTKFALFHRPDSLSKAYDIVDRLTVHGWSVGDYGVKVGLK